MPDRKLEESLRTLGVSGGRGLAVHTPISGEFLCEIASDDAVSIAEKVSLARHAQCQWQSVPQEVREAFLTHYASLLRTHAEQLIRLIVFEAGKTFPEAAGEVNGAANVIANTIKQAVAYGAGVVPARAPVGVVALITSFNFPFAVAHWTLAPALLAGNAVLWKPSEKTPLVALAAQSLFRQAIQQFNAQHQSTIPETLMQVIVGGHCAGETMIADEGVDMVSATGSVAMGQAIRRTLAKKCNAGAPPILELGGNNAAIISQHLTPEALDVALGGVLFSALASSGQRCTDTRRLIVHESHYDYVLASLRQRYQGVLDSGLISGPLELPEGKDGFGPLIDAEAFVRYRHALEAVLKEGGTIYSGVETFTAMPPDDALRLHQARYPDAYYVKPVLAELPIQREGGILHEETFASVLYLLRYQDFAEAMRMAFAPQNAGLVQALYTFDENEKARFVQACPAGHAVINSRTGTGTPAHGLGFGGCRDSGEGEILGLDPLRPFTRAVENTPLHFPTPDHPEIVTEGNITRRKYIITRPGGARTRVVEHSL